MLFPQTLSEIDLTAGTQIWVANEPTEGGGLLFLRGVVRAPPSNGLCEVTLMGQPQATACELHRLHLRSEPDSSDEKPRLCHDNVALTHLNEPALLANLRGRFEMDGAERLLYTYTGHILIVCNPFQPMPHLYDDSIKEAYKGKAIGIAPPHTYALADRAYRHCVVDKADQAIVVIGESGAGKTETAKHIVDYLAFLAQARTGALVVDQLAKTIVHTTPLLEAFGNARTLRNNNSSRFGKFLKILFSAAQGHIVGADIHTYLLEKARVTAPSGRCSCSQRQPI